MQSAPLHEVLLSLVARRRRNPHPIGRYAAAFEGLPWRVTRTVAIGGDSMVFQLDDGNILHITNKILTPQLGNRFFDLPMIVRGAVDSAGGVQVHYFVQPFAATPVSEAAMREFGKRIEAHGWLLADRSQHQLGLYQGETRLLDPFAVERMPFWRPK